MMESAEARYRGDATDLLLPSEFWGTFNPMTDLSGPRCSNRVNLEDTAQVRLVEHDEVLQKFATYRSDESAQLGCSATVSVALPDDP
jgi:hypothetical protein